MSKIWIWQNEEKTQISKNLWSRTRAIELKTTYVLLMQRKPTRTHVLVRQREAGAPQLRATLLVLKYVDLTCVRVLRIHQK